jgi:ActR/RegA family two-component response regulator
MFLTHLRCGCSGRSISRHVTSLAAVACLIGIASQSLAQDSTKSDTSIAPDLFQFPPETPEKMIEAALLTRKLDRQDDARKFLRKLLDLQLGETELKALRQRLGAGPFLELSADQKLQPEARELLQVINAASRPQPLSVGQLQELIQALATPGEGATNAVEAIVANGDSSAAALLAADPATPAGKVAEQVLKTHAREMRHGLMTELSVADAAGRSRIVQLLAGTADPNLAVNLLRWQFDPASDAAVRDAAAIAVERLSKGSLKVSTAEEASELLTQRGEALLKIAAGRFAKFRDPQIINELKTRDRRAELLNNATAILTDAVALDSVNTHAATLLLVAKSAVTDPVLTAAASAAANQEIAKLASALHAAIDIGDATAGIEILRAMKSSDFSSVGSEVLNAAGSALKQAVSSPDPRIRFLAVDVATNVAHTDISMPAVERTLKSIRTGSLKPEAVIVDSDDRSLRDLDVALEDAGFTVALSQTGQDGFDAAVLQMNTELILVDAESAGWPLATTLANFRADLRTRNTPIVVIGPERFAKRVERLSEIHPGIWFLTEPAGIDTLALRLETLLLPPHLLSPEDRATLKNMAGTK